MHFLAVNITIQFLAMTGMIMPMEMAEMIWFRVARKMTLFTAVMIKTVFMEARDQIRFMVMPETTP